MNLTKKFYRGISLITILMISTACTPSKLVYKIDPEIRLGSDYKQNASLVSIKVSDTRTKNSVAVDNKVSVNGPKNLAHELKQKLITRFQKDGFKIITDPLLADLSIQLEIEKLDVAVESELVKAKISANSHLRLKASKKSKPLEKLFKMSRTQEVAIPVNDTEVTGLVNQLLSNQLSNVFADADLV
ncbi:MAG: YajG family lipoprotein, partial [Kangiellaceae bacterium]|nr:YajG family lipoprotein [Kangiellaceae bacterium]